MEPFLTQNPEQQKVSNNHADFNSDKSLGSWSSHARFQAIFIFFPPVMQDFETIKYVFLDLT